MMARRNRNQPTPRATPQKTGPSSVRKQHLAVLAVVILGAVLRLAWLDSVPPAINQDEAVAAYDAWCLRETGQDHYGQRWPIFFRAFRDYHPGLPIYLQMPFQALLGMNPWSVRLPEALMGSLHVWLVFLLARRFMGFQVGLWSALLLAISPWHMHISRLAFGLTLSLTLVTLGLLWIFSAVQPPPGQGPFWKRHLGFLQLMGAGLVLGLALWTYHAFRVVVPLLLFGAAALYAKQIWTYAAQPRGKWGMAAFLLGLLLGVGPFLWASITTPRQAWARALSTTLLSSSQGTTDIAGRILRTYCMHFSPSFLFTRGDPYIVQHVPDYGQLHYFYALLLPLGLVRVFRRWRSERFGLLILWWILIGPVPAALTVLQAGHCLRSAGVLPAIDILAAGGLEMVLVAAARRSRRLHRGALASCTVIIAVSAACFVYLFFVPYPRKAYADFQAEWKEVCAEVRQRESDYNAVILTREYTNQLGILYLFWGKIDPKIYLKGPRHIHEGPMWDTMTQAGNVYFLERGEYLDDLRALPAGTRILMAERPWNPVPGTELRRFHYPDGRVALILYAVSASRPESGDAK